MGTCVLFTDRFMRCRLTGLKACYAGQVRQVAGGQANLLIFPLSTEENPKL